MKRRRITNGMIIGWTLAVYVFGIIIGAVTTYFTMKPNKEVETTIGYIQIIEEEEMEELKSLGQFTLTAYCPCKKCCGKSDGITATMTKAKAGRTIAIDPKVIPYGAEIIINGHTYIAEDCGGAVKGNRADIFFDSHEEALNFGVQTAEVFLK